MVGNNALIRCRRLVPALSAVAALTLVWVTGPSTAVAALGQELDRARSLVAMVATETSSDEGDDTLVHVGAAIIVGSDGGNIYLVTADHVAYPRNATPVYVSVAFWDPEGNPLVVEGQASPLRDPALDLTVLTVARTPELEPILASVPFERTRHPDFLRPKAGLDRLRTLGNPSGEGWFDSEGSERFRYREGPDLLFKAPFLMIGHSGGGLFSEDWYLLGMIKSDEPPFGRALALDRIIARLGEWNVPVSLPLAPPPPRAEEPFRDCAVCPEMVALPAGTLMMGTSVERQHRSTNEQPYHRVRIGRPFAIGIHEVAVGQFQAFADETGHDGDDGCKIWKGIWETESDKGWRDPDFPQRPNEPVVCVSWDDAEAYVAWLSEKTGKTYRLPSEAEWEYAARSGTATRFWWGDHFVDGLAVCDGCGTEWDREKPAPGGTFLPNYFGVYDMNGNVWEWVADCWHSSYDGAPGDGSAWTQGGDCERRVKRGGGWTEPGDDMRSANRNRDDTDHRNSALGFRVARDL